MFRPAALLLLFAAPAFAEEKPAPAGENFYRDCKLGDWVEAKSSNGVVTKHTVVVKTADELRITIDQTVPGMKPTPIEFIVDLTVAFPPPSKEKAAYTTKAEKLESGKETLTVNGKAYECEWDRTKHTTTVEFDGKETAYVSTVKVWRCPDVPLNWPVRSETELEGGAKVTFELTGCGRGQ